jgi:hypothetical protein
MTRLFYLLVFIILSQNISAGRYALVIGNCLYHPKKSLHAQGNLPNACEDAKLMAATLKNKNFTEVIAKYNLKPEAMQQALIVFKNKLDANSTGFFYYAGHAVQHQGRNYLLPVETTFNCQLLASQLDETKIVTSQGVLVEMEHQKTPQKILILDACRESPLDACGRTVARGLGAMKGGKGTVISYSTEAGAIAYDHSGYTREVVNAINAYGYLPIEQVLEKAGSVIAKNSSPKQTPYLDITKATDGMPFCFEECWDLAQEVAELQAQLAQSDNTPPRDVISTASAPQRDGIFKEITVFGRTYIAYNNGTALDKKTGLLWMRCLVGQTWTGSTCSGEGKRFNDWEEAKKQSANFGGYSDWRIPTIEELRTLVYCSSGQPEYFGTGARDFESCEDDYQRPTIVQAVFPNTPQSFVWSSSIHDSGKAWGVYFYYGYDSYGGYRSIRNHVRLVRGEQ